MDQKKKRVRKTHLVATLVLSCFLASFSYVQAIGYNYSPHNFSYTHGTVEVGTYLEVGTSSFLDICTILDFTFDKYYTGTVTMKWTYSAADFEKNINEWSMIVIGAKIDSTNNAGGQIVFRCYDQQGFQVIMHHFEAPTTVPTNDPGFDFTSATSSLNAVTDHNDVYDNIDSIDAKLSTINLNLVDMISDTNTIKQYCGDFLSELYDVNSALDMFSDNLINTDIENQISTLITNTNNTNTSVNAVTSSINNLRAYLLTTLGTIDIQNPSPTIIDCVNTMRTTMTNIYTDIQTLKNDVATIKSSLTTISNNLSNLLNVVGNIDNLIDTISWVNVTPLSYTVSTDFEGNNLVNNGDYLAAGTDVYYRFRLPANQTNFAKIVKFKIHTRTNSVTKTDVTVTAYYNDRLNEVIGEPNYVADSFGGFDIYYNTNLFFTANNVTCVIKIHNNNNLRFYVNSTDLEVSYVDSDDIEYFSLLGYFNTFNQYRIINNFNQDLYQRLADIITAINNITVTVNVTDQEVTNITNNFDTDIDIIHNIENNYGLNFDSWDDQLTSNDISLDLLPYNDTINLFKTNITSLWSSPIVSMPIILSCLVFVFLVILG